MERRTGISIIRLVTNPVTRGEDARVSTFRMRANRIPVKQAVVSDPTIIKIQTECLDCIHFILGWLACLLESPLWTSATKSLEFHIMAQIPSNGTMP